jgi:hypothetical protein
MEGTIKRESTSHSSGQLGVDQLISTHLIRRSDVTRSADLRPQASYMVCLFIDITVDLHPVVNHSPSDQLITRPAFVPTNHTATILNFR